MGCIGFVGTGKLEIGVGEVLWMSLEIESPAVLNTDLRGTACGLVVWPFMARRNCQSHFDVVVVNWWK